MKILLLNCSPVRNGATAEIVKIIGSYLSSAAEISQYPPEDILDEFGCWISDFYYDLNTEDSTVCYQEFASGTQEEIKNLRSIIGKHVYEKNDGSNMRFCVE